jgi:hypothetical protein
MSFDAVKYRTKVRAIATHAHLKLHGELGTFLFRNWKQNFYSTGLFEQFRQAHYSAEAIYNLPFTIAEGFAVKHKVPRDVFLSRIQLQMTLGEKLRLQGAAERTEIDINVDFGRLPLTKLALYILSLPWEMRQQQRDILHQALKRSARLALKKAPLELGKVAAVLDCSYSSSGSSEKRRRPLGVAMAAHYLLKAAAREYQAFWTIPVEDSLQVTARGQTDLATPLLAALTSGAELVVIISDGCENDPPNGAAEALRVYRTKLDPSWQTSIIHCNPVFNSDDFCLRTLSPFVPTVGLRDAEDLPTMLNFARFAEGSAPLSELETYLTQRVQQFLTASSLISSNSS